MPETFGTSLWIDGVEWMGVTCFGGGWWLAYRADDPTRAVHLVEEQET